MDNLNYKTQAYAKVCKENKLQLEEKMTAYQKIFVERSTVRCYHRNGEEMDLIVLICDDAS